jgi:transposase
LYFIDSTIVKAQRWGARGKRGRKIRRSASAAAAGPRKSMRLSTAKAVLRTSVTGGQVYDSEVVEEVLNTPRALFAVSADKAYDNKEARQHIKDEGALPVIPSRSNATKKAYCPKSFYRQCYKIVNFFCRAKDWRRIAARYDKLARNFLAATLMVGTLY